MTDAWESVKIKRFEHVLVGPSIAMLRVTGKPARRKLTSDRRPTLLADDGRVVQRFAALPSPADERGVLRAAYPVPADAIKPDAVFSLELADGSAVALPEPLPGAPRFDAGDDAEPAEDRIPAQPPVPAEVTSEPGADDRRSELTAKLAELSAALAESEHAGAALQAARAAAVADAAQARTDAEALAQRLDELSRQAAASEAEAIRARERADQAEAETAGSAATLNELEIWRGELKRTLTATTSELDAARTRQRADERELHELRGQLAEAQAGAERAQAEVDSRQEPAEAGRLAPPGQAAIGMPALERLTVRLAELADGLAQARADADSLQALAGEGDGTPANGRAAPPTPPEGSPQAAAELEAISRRAEAEAAARAARELAQAADEGRSRP